MRAQRRRRVISIVVAACGPVVGSAGGAGVALAATPTPPKNVILFVGDGMGPEQVKAAGYYFNGAAGQFNFEQFPQFAWMTHNNSSTGVTDSAASATAMATGFKVDDGVISVAQAVGTDPRSATPSDGRPLLTLLETFKNAGKSTGLVTTSYATDATPAAFGAHEVSRNNYAQIAADYFNASRPNVIFGGSQTGFDAAAATAAGYTTATNRAQLQAINTATTTHAAGVFGSGGFAYAYDQSTGGTTFYNTQPYLQEMTQTALDLLDNDSDGFFLLVENELTDSSGHLAVTEPTKVQRNLFEVRELSRAVQKAIDFAATHPDTLILVTADHETGSFTANQNNGIGVLPSVTSGSGSHTAGWVPLYAYGAGAKQVSGHADNTQIKAIGQGALPEQARAARKLFRQGQDGYGSAHDTQVRSDLPANTYGATATLVVDQDDNGAAGSQPVQSVVRFDDLFAPAASGGIPAGSTIRSAKLTLHTGAVSSDGSAATLEAHRLLVPFTEATTWNTAGNVVGNGFSLNNAGAADDDYLVTAESFFPAPDANSLASFDVTATLTAWLADPASARGWVILSNTADGWRWDSTEAANAALRPSLEIAYVPDFALGVAWSFSGDGNWSQDAKWSVGLAPDSPDAVVHFPATGGVGHTVTLTAPAALRALVFDSPKTYAITGTGALSFGANAAIDVPAGTHTIAAPIALSDALAVTVAAGASLGVSGHLAANGHAITKAGAGTLELKNARAGALAVNAGMVTITPNGSSAATSRVASLSIASGATLDLKDNDLVVTAPAAAGTWDGSAYTGVTGLIARGRADGTWTGGLVTTDVRAVGTNDLATLGVATASEALALAPGATAAWSGQTVLDSDTLVLFTWGGDANLDGKINIDDYGRIDFNVASGTAHGWYNGDFNYDGKINIDDYGIIDYNVTAQTGTLLSSSPESSLVAVPETASVASAVVMLSASLFTQRRRTRRAS